MAYTLIITEKPSAAQKIAEALADGKPIKKAENKVPYYEITHKGEDIVVCSAVGHLYTVTEKEKKGWTYPVFETVWMESSKASKASKFTSKYVSLINKLAKKADKFIVATDYDIEGEVIGYNVVRFLCKKKDAMRMKFSTLTKDELRESYEHKSKSLDWGQVNAGLTRHVLDWYYGINLSRALSLAIKKAGQFKVLSAGRVQGPALKIIVEKEKEIQAFKPEQYWEIEMNWFTDKSHNKSNKNNKDDNKHNEIKNKDIFIAKYERGKFGSKKEAEKIIEKTKNAKSAEVVSLEKNKFKQEPPTPFDLTTLQTEAYRCFKIQPNKTLEIAQELYVSGYISYPRTSSQQLPPSIGYNKIMNSLHKNKKYSHLAEELLKGQLKPNNGKKTDPAHPAIYPTGVQPKLTDEQEKIYDLIIKRFFATFADAAERETLIINLDAKGEQFATRGTLTVHKGWHVFYSPYVILEELELPLLKEKELVNIQKILLLEKETKPPKRYTPASIIRELEKRNLGTKATRAGIIETLFDRGYVVGQSLEATNLGIKIVETLAKHAPTIIDEELTSHFEMEMDGIRENKKKSENVLDEAKEVLTNTLEKFKKKEKNIGEELIDATRASEQKQNTVGRCINCGEGNLMMRRGKYGMFIACDKYPECKTTYSLPKSGLIKATEEVCEECKSPKIMIIKKGRKPQLLCINPDCPTKKIDVKTNKEGKLDKKCPKCSKELVVRKSTYGEFIGCSGYPDCRYTERS